MDVLLPAHDLSEEYLRFAAQVGADGIDVGPGAPELIPGVREQGVPDERGVRDLLRRLRGWGLRLCRVSTFQPVRFLLDLPGGAEEVDRLCRTLLVLADAGIPVLSLPLDYIPTPTSLAGFTPDHSPTPESFVGFTPWRGLHGHDRHGRAPGVHRGGYTMVAFDLTEMQRSLAAGPPTLVVDYDTFFERCVRLYERLVPLAEASGIRLALHPSDPPLPETPFSPRRWSRILDAVPSPHNGLLYCVGTRYESGVNIEDDIRAFGRRGAIVHVHFRNVRGTLPTTGGYEEVALHDGDMNMLRVLLALKRVGYDGGLQVDHLPSYTGDTPYQSIAAAYAVGYIKALLAATEAAE